MLSGKVLGKRLSRLTVELKGGVERLREGDLDYRVNLNTDGEQQQLGDSFSAMVTEIKEQVKAHTAALRKEMEERKEVAGKLAERELREAIIQAE